MALINRVARLFKADIHAVLDHIEEPEQLLKQSIRDMQDLLADGESRLRIQNTELAALDNRRAELEDRLRNLNAELDLCFAKGKDELARGVVKRKLQAEKLAQHLDGQFAARRQAVDQLREEYAQNQAALVSLKQKAEILVDHAPRDDLREPSHSSSELSVSDADVEIAFLREQESRLAS